MTDAKKDELRELLYEYDRALRDFEKDHTVIFPSREERLRLFYALRKRRSKNWTTPGLCMHAGCTATAIPRSHTVPMSASLKVIAENGHVVTPRFGESGIEMVRIGIREASTFPGFCTTHEALFSGFESELRLTEESHFYLQAFRTLCREIFTKKHYKLMLESELDEYRGLRIAFVNARLDETRAQRPLKVTSLQFDNDPTEKRILDRIDSLSRDLLELDTLYHGLLDQLHSSGSQVSVIAGIFDLQLPVCPSGLGVLHYRVAGVANRALCFLGIIPEATETKIILGAEKQHAEALAVHMRDESSPAVLERLERWMCNGSDHWFMRPSAWAAIPQARKDAICERILSTSHSMGDPVEFSILDGPREHILAFAEAQLRDRNVTSDRMEDCRVLIAEERRKLNWIPRAS